MNKSFVPLIIFVLILVGGFLALNAYIYQQKQVESPQSLSQYRGTLTGEYVCLPPKDTTSPQTLECAFGLKTDVGEYYALDVNLLSQNLPDLTIGDRFTATGNITPIEMLSSDHWQKYNVSGIFSVTDSVQKL